MKKLLLATTITLALTACSVRNHGALEHWTNYTSDNLNASQLDDKHALAVFYRTADFQGSSVNVYINGDYQASLLSSGYTSVPVCANHQLIGASFSDDHQFGNRVKGESYVLPVKEVAFFRVNRDQNGNPVFEQVEEQLARQELKGLSGKVTHTLPRVTHDLECKEVVLSNVRLSAQALWGLDKYSYKDMLPQGKQEIAEFAKFAKGNGNIDHIDIRGYTDPSASDKYNLALSQRRANTVREALQKAGVTQKITAIGYGKADLVVPNCRELHKDKVAIAKCNQPNRRVEITTYGK